MSEYTLPFEASFSLYDPNGVRVYFKIQDASMPPVNAHINGLLSDGYTVQEPVPEAGEKRYRITRYTHTTQRQDNGTELPVINLWDENGSYPQLTVYPTTYLDGTQVTSDIIHLFTDMGDVTPTDMTQRDKVKPDCWGRVNLTAIGVPKLDHEGNVVHTSSGYVKYRFLKVEGTGTNPPAPSTNGSGPAESDSLKTWQKWTSKQDAIDWSVDSGASTNEHSAENAMGNAVMQVLGDKNARPENKQQCEAIYQAFYFERMERLNSRMDEAAQPDEELPF